MRGLSFILSEQIGMSASVYKVEDFKTILDTDVFVAEVKRNGILHNLPCFSLALSRSLTLLLVISHRTDGQAEIASCVIDVAIVAVRGRELVVQNIL